MMSNLINFITTGIADARTSVTYIFSQLQSAAFFPTVQSSSQVDQNVSNGDHAKSVAMLAQPTNGDNPLGVPVEIFVKICRLASARDRLLILRNVSRKWRATMDNNKLVWSEYDLTAFKESDWYHAAVRLLALSDDKITQLALGREWLMDDRHRFIAQPRPGEARIQPLLTTILQKSTRLQELTVSSQHLQHILEDNNKPDLDLGTVRRLHIHIHQTTDPDRIVNWLVTYFATIQDLSITGIPDFEPPAILGCHVPNFSSLTRLSLEVGEDYPAADHWVSRLIPKMPNVQFLALKNSPTIGGSEPGTDPIDLTSLTALTELVIEGAMSIGPMTFLPPSLEKITVYYSRSAGVADEMACYRQGTNQLVVPSLLPKLKVLDLQFNPEIATLAGQSWSAMVEQSQCKLQYLRVQGTFRKPEADCGGWISDTTFCTQTERFAGNLVKLVESGELEHVEIDGYGRDCKDDFRLWSMATNCPNLKTLIWPSQSIDEDEKAKAVKSDLIKKQCKRLMTLEL